LQTAKDNGGFVVRIVVGLIRSIGMFDESCAQRIALNLVHCAYLQIECYVMFYVMFWESIDDEERNFIKFATMLFVTLHFPENHIRLFSGSKYIQQHTRACRAALGRSYIYLHDLKISLSAFLDKRE